MEVFRYWTRSKLEAAQKKGVIESNQPTFRFPKHLFVLPNDPMLWGVERMEGIANHVRENHREKVVDGLVLFKFIIQQTDPDVFIRDLYGKDLRAWYPLAAYPVESFELPEIIVPTPIDTNRIIQLSLPKELTAWERFAPYGVPQLQRIQT